VGYEKNVPPKNIESYISEARYCYAFERYNAVYSLCRTILDVSIKYLYCIKEMKDIEYIAKKKFSICDLIKKLCENFEDIKDEIISENSSKD